MTLRCEKIIVSGGGSGIGLAIAKKLVSMGAQVTVMGRTEEKLRRAVRELGIAARPKKELRPIVRRFIQQSCEMIEKM